MEDRILEALAERGYQFESLEEAQGKLSPQEILEEFLEYEGIIGYTGVIIQVMTILGFIPQK